MKRHKSLYPLSHDHHHALVQARNLRLAAADPALSSLRPAAAVFIAFWDASLHPHFLLEEEILLPLFAKYSSAEAAEITETLKQHGEIRQRFGALRKSIDEGSEPEAESLGVIAALLVEHIRYEESHLFPAVENAVPEEEMWEMNRQMSERRDG